jgi:Restriction endonuclease
MSFNKDRIGHESGEWFERYVQDIFRFAGFRTERDKLFFKSVKHEIDVWAETDFASVAVECKDWSWLRPDNIKREFDAFIQKVRVLSATTGIFAVNLPDRAVYDRYRRYLKENGLTLWDSGEVEKLHDDMERYDQIQYQKRLCDAIGVLITEPTKTEKTFKMLKAFGKAAYKTAKVVGENLAEEERPRRRRRKSRRHRHY